MAYRVVNNRPIGSTYYCNDNSQYYSVTRYWHFIIVNCPLRTSSVCLRLYSVICPVPCDSTRSNSEHADCNYIVSCQSRHRRGGSKGWPGEGDTAPCESWPHLCSPNETVCKVARLYNTCIYSVASHSWCQITPFTQSCIMSSGILGPQIQIWRPQTAAARNALRPRGTSIPAVDNRS